MVGDIVDRAQVKWPAKQPVRFLAYPPEECRTTLVPGTSSTGILDAIGCVWALFPLNTDAVSFQAPTFPPSGVEWSALRCVDVEAASSHSRLIVCFPCAVLAVSGRFSPFLFFFNVCNIVIALSPLLLPLVPGTLFPSHFLLLDPPPSISPQLSVAFVVLLSSTLQDSLPMARWKGEGAASGVEGCAERRSRRRTPQVQAANSTLTTPSRPHVPCPIYPLPQPHLPSIPRNGRRITLGAVQSRNCMSSSNTK